MLLTAIIDLLDRIKICSWVSPRRRVEQHVAGLAALEKSVNEHGLADQVSLRLRGIAEVAADYVGDIELAVEWIGQIRFRQRAFHGDLLAEVGPGVLGYILSIELRGWLGVVHLPPRSAAREVEGDEEQECRCEE